MSGTAAPPSLSRSAVVDRVAAFAPISLPELNEVAALQTRVDRKYVLSPAELTDLLDQMARRVSVLDIDGDRAFAYESVYFDTPQLDCFRAAAHHRRRRFKVRTRSYAAAGSTVLEVKTKGPRNATVKQRRPHGLPGPAELDPAGRAFVVATAGCAPAIADTLRSVLRTGYRRLTLVDLDDTARLTVDADLRCRDRRGRTVSLGDHVIVETKTGGRPSAADRWLWARGRRPERISKFATGMAALDHELPANRWHRTLERYGWSRSESDPLVGPR